jgi:hypothetical protein
MTYKVQKVKPSPKFNEIDIPPSPLPSSISNGLDKVSFSEYLFLSSFPFLDRTDECWTVELRGKKNAGMLHDQKFYTIL